MVNEQRLVILIALFFIIVAGAGLNPLPGPYGDNGRYIVLAQSLLHGTGMRLINYPSEPFDVKIPPLYPLFLALVMSVFGYHLLVVKCSSVVLMCLALVFFYAALRRAGMRQWLALSVLFLAAINPYTIEYSREVLSEASFVFLLSVALWGWVRYGQESRLSHAGLALLASVAASLVRDAGMLLLVCLAGSFLGRKKYSFAALSSLACVSLAALWLRKNLHTDLGYLNEFFVSSTQLTRGQLPGPLIFMKRYVYEACAYIGNSLPEYLLAPLGSIAPHTRLWALKIATGVGAFSITLIGFFVLRKNKASGLLVALPLVYAVSLPLFGTYGLRYMAVIGFFILAAFVAGIDRILPRKDARVLAAVFSLVLISSGFVEAQQIRYARKGYPGAWQEYYRALSFVKNNSDPGAVVICRKEFIGFILSGRRTLGLMRVADAEKGFKALRDSGASHVIIDSLDPEAASTAKRVLLTAIKKYPASFRLRYRQAEPLTEVYEIIR